METTIAAIPITAWQQAAIVVLFVVLIYVLLRIVLEHIAQNQRDTQDFICRRDEQWQKYLDSRDTQRDGQLANVARTLERVAEMLEAHDDKVDQRISQIRSAANEPKTGRRPKVQP